MAKFKIIYDRNICIGAFACSAAAPDFWLYGEDGKADLKSGSYNVDKKQWELVVDQKDLDDNQAAAEACPVFAIKIVKLNDDGSEEELKE